MRVAITGSQGFIGSNLADRLVNDEHEVIGIDNQSAIYNEKFYFNDKVEYHYIDICNFEKLKEVFKGVDAVFHLAAESRIQPTIENPVNAVKVNVLGTANVLQAARECNVDRVIYSSSSANYGLKNPLPLKEDMRNDCLNPYALTKAQGEDLCILYNDFFNLKTICFRYFNVYGFRSPTKGQYAPVVGIFLKQFRNNEPMTIVGDGLQRRDFTNVFDVVEANICALKTDNKEAFGQSYNVGSGVNYSMLDIVKEIGGKYEFVPKRIGEARNTLADISKIKKYLGWEPKIDFLEWLKAELKGS